MNIGDASLWNEYGLPGLVIFAGFATFFWFGRSVLKRNEAAEKEHQAFLDRLLETHRVERSEWREDADRRGKEQHDMLRDLHERSLEVCEKNTAAVAQLVQEIRAVR